jgi:RNA polymerase sigma factor (sigma-70 family)
MEFDIELLKAKDPVEWAKFYNREYRIVTGYLVKMFPYTDREEIVDAVSNGFLKCFENIARFDTSQHACYYFTKSAKGYCMRHEFKHKKRLVPLMDFREFEAQSKSHNMSFSYEQSDKMHAAIEKLPSEMKKVVDLYLMGLEGRDLLDQAGIQRKAEAYVLVRSAKTMIKNMVDGVEVDSLMRKKPVYAPDRIAKAAAVVAKVWNVKKEKIQKAYLSGMTNAQITRAFGYSVASVSRATKGMPKPKKVAK